MRNHFSFRRKRVPRLQKEIFLRVSGSQAPPTRRRPDRRALCPTPRHEALDLGGIRQQKRRLWGASCLQSSSLAVLSILGSQKFSSTFFKRWRIPKAAPLAARRSARNPLSFKSSGGVRGTLARGSPLLPKMRCVSMTRHAEPFFFRRKRVPPLQKESTRGRQSPRRFFGSGFRQSAARAS